jgi:hypothetical protein
MEEIYRKEIDNIRNELYEKFNIRTDSDIFKVLNLSEEDLNKLILWIYKQDYFSKTNIINNGVECESEIKSNGDLLKDLENQKTFYKSSENVWFDGKFDFKLVKNEKYNEFILYSHNESDGSTWYLKRIENINQLKNIYEALTSCIFE